MTIGETRRKAKPTDVLGARLVDDASRLSPAQLKAEFKAFRDALKTPALREALNAYILQEPDIARALGVVSGPAGKAGAAILKHFAPIAARTKLFDAAFGKSEVDRAFPKDDTTLGMTVKGKKGGKTVVELTLRAPDITPYSWYDLGKRVVLIDDKMKWQAAS